MNSGRGGWLISLHARSNLPAEARSADRLTFQVLCRFSSFYLSVSLLFWLPITEDWTVLKLTIANGAKLAHIQSPWTPTYFRGLYRDVGHANPSCPHFNWIFELKRSLRSNHPLYSDTMPLRLQDSVPPTHINYCACPIHHNACDWSQI